MLAKRLDEAGLSPRPHAARWAARGHRLRDRAGWWPCGPTSTRCRSTTAPTTPGPARSRESRTPAGTTSTPRRCSAPVSPSQPSPTELPGRVRLIFQPAEETMPGGALMAIDAGALDDVSRIFGAARRPDPRRRHRRPARGPAHRRRPTTSTCCSPARAGTPRGPHLTEDLTFALGKLVTELPAVLSRRLDPRAGVSVVWGMVRSGSAVNVIPDDRPRRRHRADARRRRLGRRRGAGPRDHRPDRGSPTACWPTSPTSAASRRWSTSTGRRGCSAGPWSTCSATTATSPPPRASAARTSPGTSTRVPGAMARLGTRTPGGPTYDLHQGDLRVDERSISVGATVLADAALDAMVTDAITLAGHRRTRP